jgi:GrpB-like predicted nucleotidyltransferase (UPF0157 family)
MRTAPQAIGLERSTVRIAPYDRRWPALFEEEAARIRRRLGGALLALEHVGSTAVPGLAAKPIIDLMLAVASLRVPLVLFEMLGQLGYQHRPLDPIADRLYFVMERNGLRTHHLHVCELDSTFWTSHLRFRNRLRSDPELAKAYEGLKFELAAQFPNDRLAYTDAKEPFVVRALAARIDDAEPRVTHCP